MIKHPESPEDYMRRYPRIVAHIIAESLGYATPTKAAIILKDAKEGRENWCEWVWSCYKCNPRIPVENAIRNRSTHMGYMADYGYAYAIVRNAIDTGKEPIFASWF